MSSISRRIFFKLLNITFSQLYLHHNNQAEIENSEAHPSWHFKEAVFPAQEMVTSLDVCRMIRTLMLSSNLLNMDPMCEFFKHCGWSICPCQYVLNCVTENSTRNTFSSRTGKFHTGIFNVLPSRNSNDYKIAVLCISVTGIRSATRADARTVSFSMTEIAFP